MSQVPIQSIPRDPQLLFVRLSSFLAPRHERLSYLRADAEPLLTS